jgi:putative PEP-CTERM system TPR-repeat lipoprotein
MNQNTSHLLSPLVFSFLLFSVTTLISKVAFAEDLLVNKTQANEHFEKALIGFDEQDYRTTMIHLKNTFKSQRNHLAGRILYARILLAHNNGIGAEVTLNYANELGADLSITQPLQAKALLYQQRFKAALEVTLPGNRGNTLEVEMAYLRGQAFMGLKKFFFAEENFDRALKLNPKHSLATLGKAQIYISRKQLDRATKYTDKALQGYNIPKNARVIRAKLYLARGNTDAALAQLNKVIKEHPSYLSARLLKAEVLLSQGEIELAEVDIDYILDKAPNEPQTNYLKVLTSKKNESAEQVESSLSNILVTLNALPEGIRKENPQYLYLAGYILYRQNNLTDAAKFFNQYIDRVNDYRAIVMLAQIAINQKEYQNAKKILIKANSNFPKNEVIINLLAQSFMGLKQYKDAQRYYVKSLEINPHNPEVVLQFSKSFTALGNDSKALELLYKVEYIFPNMIPTLLAINTSLNNLKKFKQASTFSEKLISITPNNAYYQFLHGKNLLANRQFSEAEASFNQAIILAPDYVGAKVALTEFQIIKGDTAQAKADLEGLLAEYPKNINIMSTLAYLHFSLDEYNNSVLWLERVLAEDKDNIKALIALEGVYRKTNQLDKIQIKLENALEKTASAKLHELLGGIYLTQRKHSKAIKEYQYFVELSENRGAALSVLANVQFTIKDIDGAISSLRKALIWNNEIVSSHILLTKLLMANNQDDQALAQITIIHSKDKSGAIGTQLEADLLYKRGNYLKAVTFYQKSLKAKISTTAVLSLYRTYKKLNRLNAAEQLLTKQIDNIPQLNLEYIIALADVYQLQQQNTEAINLYKNALEHYPNSPPLLNNLANSLVENEEFTEAYSFAQRAITISPESVNILDTLARTQIQLKKYDAALTNLRKALAINAESNSVKYHLAIALNKLNRRKSAQQYLIQIVESKQPFKYKKQAKQQLDTWMANDI